MQTDKDLIKDALKGKQLAYEKLMERYYDSIYVMVLHLVGNMTDAEEITQESFTKAFSKLSLYDEKYPFSSWLFGIASNGAVDFLRKRKYVEITLEEDENSESPQPNPEEHLIQKQDVGALKEKVEALKEHYRKLLELRYFEEYTYEEISQELSLPMGTVKTQLHRAKLQLLKGLKK